MTSDLPIVCLKSLCCEVLSQQSQDPREFLLHFSSYMWEISVFLCAAFVYFELILINYRVNLTHLPWGAAGKVWHERSDYEHPADSGSMRETLSVPRWIILTLGGNQGPVCLRAGFCLSVRLACSLGSAHGWRHTAFLHLPAWRRWA